MLVISNKERDVWKRILKECDIVFDVGVQSDNVFYELKPELREIHLFEPHAWPELISEIKDKSNIFFNDVALGSKDEKRQFYFGYGSFLYRPEEPKFSGLFGKDYQKEVQIIRLDEYVKEHNIGKIDFLKIDTDGFDYEVIKGCGDFLDKIKYIQFEDWTLYWSRKDSGVTKFSNGESTEDVIKFFVDKGYNVYDLWCADTNIMNYIVTKENIDYLPETKI